MIFAIKIPFKINKNKNNLKKHPKKHTKILMCFMGEINYATKVACLSFR